MAKSKSAPKPMLNASLKPAPKPAPKPTVKTKHRGPRIEKDANLFQIGIITFFTAIVMVIVRMGVYQSNMDQFFWSTGGTTFVDFFSLVKSQFILGLTVLAILVLLYKIVTQTLVTERSPVYIPMLVYASFVAISYTFSPYKEYALFGWNDRFEGTLILIAYMIMLFYIINTVNSEKHVKWIIYPLAVTSTILGFLGITQYYMADFFQTSFGKKLITPSSYWPQVDKLKFNFEGGQIYQTVFNPNYVSFYLTLLVPLFAMLFIRENRILIKSAYGFIFGLSLFNLIGSASSNGIVGLAVSFILALIVLNKRLIEWKKPVLILLIITAIIGSLTFTRFLPELTGAVKGATGLSDSTSQGATSTEPGAANVNESATQSATGLDTAATQVALATSAPFVIDYFETGAESLIVSINGNVLTVIPKTIDNTLSIALKDAEGKAILINGEMAPAIGRVEDPRFNMLRFGFDSNDGTNYLVMISGEEKWPFALTADGIFYRNGIGKLVALTNTPHIGFENNQSFGSYRGYIWSRSLPILKDTLFIGKGADTFCIYFPQNDYAGRYSVKWSTNIIVDKAHNMYLATALNTGMISLLSLLALFGLYLVQSFPLYRKLSYAGDYLAFCGAGIFIGISGFLVSAVFNDSSVSVMPLFYGLLGTGLAINRLLNRRNTRL